MDHSQVFSDDKWRPITMALNLVVLVLISWFAAKRTPDSVNRWRMVSATDLAVCLTMLTSLLFVWLSAFLIFGLGTSRSFGVCSLGHFICSIFYANAKVTTSWFLVERARLVTAPLVPRLKNKNYLFNLSLMILWVFGLVLALVWPGSDIRPADNECLIILRPGVLGTFIGIDLFLNAYYTALFAVPLLRGRWKNPRLKRLAVKSALAAVLTVSSSVINLGIYAGHHGRELSWVCLSACTLDTVWCAGVLCALTGKREDEQVADAGARSERPSVCRANSGASAYKFGSMKSANPFALQGGGAAHLTVDGDGEGVAGWGSFGRIELGEGSVGGNGNCRRGSAAPDEMCLGAMNERKVVDGAWKAPSPLQVEDSDDEKEKEDDVEGGPVLAVAKVGFVLTLDKRDEQ